MRRLGRVWIGIATAALLDLPGLSAQESTPEKAVLESDAIFWVPTIDQAVEMAKATGKPIFSMGYSLVPDGTTYTQKADNCPKGVF